MQHPLARSDRASGGRRHPETPHAFRTEYQRDRDRVIHSSAFRRLQGKTQVFVTDYADHPRTRLTHTLEVAQIARTLARALGFNEDLTEATALAHDLGHPPFGHAGEEELDRLMRGHGGFEHNIQSFRIVEKLERAYPGFAGLNLTRETRLGVFAHSPRTGWRPSDFEGLTQPPLEGQLADMADEIAYTAHDMEDGFASGLLRPEALAPSALFARNWDPGQAVRDGSRRVGVRNLVRGVIGTLGDAVIRETRARAAASGLREPDEVLRHDRPLVGLDADAAAELAALKGLLADGLYRHPDVVRATRRRTRALPTLFHHYLDHPEGLPPHVGRRMERTKPQRVVCDYLAGMTDRFTMRCHRALKAGRPPPTRGFPGRL